MQKCRISKLLRGWITFINPKQSVGQNSGLLCLLVAVLVIWRPIVLVFQWNFTKAIYWLRSDMKHWILLFVKPKNFIIHFRGREEPCLPPLTEVWKNIVKKAKEWIANEVSQNETMLVWPKTFDKRYIFLPCQPIQCLIQCLFLYGQTSRQNHFKFYFKQACF